MKKREWLAVLAIIMILPGCASIVLKRENAEAVRRSYGFTQIVKQCTSEKIDAIISMEPPVKDPKEMWSRKTVRIEIKPKEEFDGYNLAMPLVLAWYHTLTKGQTRTFSDFPTFMEDKEPSGKPTFSKEKMKTTMKPFLSEIDVSRPITFHTIRSLILIYLGLIEECLY